MDCPISSKWVGYSTAQIEGTIFHPSLQEAEKNLLISRVVHNYVLWRLVMAMVPHMMDDYQRERVQFRKILLGILSERHRWSQCVEMTNKKLGMAVGVLFIRDNFNQESKVSAVLN